MNSSIWGPSAWNFLHCITMEYPFHPSDEEKENYKIFFNQLKYVLPCQECKEHFKTITKKYPIDKHLNSQKSLFKYIFKIHNLVSKKLNKKTYSFKEIEKFYLNLSKNCNKC